MEERHPAVLAPNEIVLPSGELVRLDHPDEVAGARLWMTRAEDQMRELKAVLDGHLQLVSERQGSKTFEVGRFRVEMTAGTEVVWDIEKLRDGLRAADCPEERIDALIKTEVTEKVNASVAKQMSGANDRYKAAILAAQETREKRQYAKVSTW